MNPLIRAFVTAFLTLVICDEESSLAQYKVPIANASDFHAGSYVDQDPSPGTRVMDSEGNWYEKNDHIKDWMCIDGPNFGFAWCGANTGKLATTYNGHKGWDIVAGTTTGWEIYRRPSDGGIEGGTWTKVDWFVKTVCPQFS